MRAPFRWSFLCLLVGCAAEPGARGPTLGATASAVRRTASLRERLSQELGADRPVAVVAAESGVVAVGLDGRTRHVVRAPVVWVFVDDRAGVLWYEAHGSDGFELWLLDWSLPTAVPERVAKGLGTKEPEEVAIAYAETRYSPEEVTTHASDYDGYLRVLVTAAGPLWSYEPGLYDSIFERTDEARASRLAPLSFVATAPARLRELNERGRGKHLLLGPLPLPERHPLTAVAPERCWDRELCGRAQALPGTRFLRVIVAHECGDACHVRYQLFDSRTREFFDLASGARSAHPIDEGKPESVADAWIAAKGEGFVIDAAVYDHDAKLLFQGSGRGGGWLGGQWHLN
jgi:hypothetical protein